MKSAVNNYFTFAKASNTFIIIYAIKFELNGILINNLSTISADASGCLRDDEFGRQALAGINPLSIERLKVILGSIFIIIFDC